MKVACVFVVLCGIACALSAPTDSSNERFISTPTVTVESNNVTKYLRASHRASLNFACKVERITVTPNFDSFAVGFEDPLTQIELEDHLGEPENIEWAHVPQMHFESVDPRGQEREIATLGGDLGEFLIVLAAAEAKTGKTYTKGEVLQQFKIFLTVMSRDKFFFSIDADGVNNLKNVCGCPNLNIADPPESKKGLLLNATHEAASHGDEFFKKVIANPEKFGIRGELVNNVLDAFFSVMWLKSDPLHRRIKFVLMKGPLAPKGFIMVKTPGYCNAQLLAPMLSPELCGKQMGIYHGDAAVLLRTEIAGIVLIKSPEDKNQVVVQANEIASKSLTAILADHPEPVYTVSFEGF